MGRPPRRRLRRAGDGGAWLTGDAARAIACDAMIVPVVTGDLDPGALEDLVGLCVRYDQARHGCPDPAAPPDGQPDTEGAGTADGGTAETLGRLEQQILARVIQIISGPGGLASFLRRNLLGKPLAGPSLPLDVGQTDEIPIHLRRLVGPAGPGLRVPRRILPPTTLRAVRDLARKEWPLRRQSADLSSAGVLRPTGGR